MDELTTDSGHRPWPLPERRWAILMRWEDLLFMHWPVRAEVLRPVIPAGLELDLHNGQAWFGVTPFRISGFRLRWMPALPRISDFPEVNVRTYVTAGGKPGVWFFSLDAGRRLAVWGARVSFSLPYYTARIAVRSVAGTVEYQSRRVHWSAPPAQLDVNYRSAGESYNPRPNDLDHWLTERYCLYAADGRGRLWRGEIHHAPWPLQPAEAEVRVNTMALPIGLELEGKPLLHFSRRLDVVGWWPQRV